MKHSITSLLLALLVFFAPINANIIDIKSIEQVGQHVDTTSWGQETIVFFDLDHTLMHDTDPDSLFSDHGFGALAKHCAEKCNMSRNDMYQHLLPFWFTYQETATMQPVEAATVAFIQQLQGQGVMVVGLTSRSVPVAHTTQHQVQNQIGVIFSDMQEHANQIDFSDLTTPACYHHGINHCGNNGKAPIAKKILDVVRPTRVIMFDDLVGHVEKVKACVEAFSVHNNHQIEFFGFRYGFLDEIVRNFKLDTNKIPDSINTMIIHHNLPGADELP